VFLGWAFFEASGGMDFVPAERPVVAAPVPTPTATPEPEPAPAPVIRPAPDPATPVVPPVQPAPEPENEPATTFESLSRPGNNDIGAAPPSEAPISLAAPAPDLRDLRLVTGDRVNMRTGPGTVYPVVTTLSRDTEVAVVETSTNGWASIQVLATGENGWISLRLLTEAQQ